MRKAVTSALLIMTIGIPALAAKNKGSTTLKDFQPFGTTDKQHKHQAYDLVFDADNKNYTCRTDYKKSTNATDFAVGGSIDYEIEKQKIKIKTPENNKVECKIVRVENLSATSASR